MAISPVPAISPTPYGTYVLAESTSVASITTTLQQQILQEYLDVIQAALVSSGTSTSGTVTQFGPVIHHGVTITGQWFETRTPSKWESSLVDTTNELLLICVAKNRVAFYASNATFRRILLTSIGNPSAPAALADLSKIPSSRLIAAFLNDHQLKALWLSGTHKSVQAKADSKVLSGSDLKYALDPLSDSSYLAAAVRQERMGVSLRGSAVWTRPHRTIVSFAEDVQTIFGDLEANGAMESTLPILANELNSFASVGAPFDFDLAAPEALRLKSQQKKVIDLATQYSFQISVSTAPGAQPWAFDLHVSPWPHIQLAGTLHVQIEPAFTTSHSDSYVGFTVTPVTAPILPWMQNVVDTIDGNPEIFRVFYNSGHTIAAGALSVAHPMDTNFEDWKWLSFANMPGHSTIGTPAWVHVEKPKNNDLTRIWTAPKERSLFAWFVRTLNNPVEANKMDLQPLQNGTQNVWLFCDDDAGEVADFVHVFNPPTGTPRITLVHIKGAHNDSPNREMVAGPYEVVCGQAVKNLRYLPSFNLVDRLSLRIYDTNRPLWDSEFAMNVAPSGDRDLFFNVLCSIGADATYAVLIIQPHVTKAAFDLPKNAPMIDGAELGAIQLRTLLFGVKSNASAVSACFKVVGSA